MPIQKLKVAEWIHDPWISDHPIGLKILGEKGIDSGGQGTGDGQAGVEAVYGLGLDADGLFMELRGRHDPAARQ